MDVLGQHEISEAHHRILNPFTDEKLMLLGEVCRLTEGRQQLDLASGKGEMLCRWAQAYGTGGLGVDISGVFVPAARARALELGVDDRVRFELGDAGGYRAEPGAYDIVSCIGATWIGGGLAGTVGLMLTALRPGGLVLVGEPFWREDPPPGAAEALGLVPGQVTTLVGTLDRLAACGLQLVETVMADEDSWDRYVAGQWWAVAEWIDENQRDQQDAAGVAEMRAFLERSRRSHLEYGRRYLGWGVFVFRAA